MADRCINSHMVKVHHSRITSLCKFGVPEATEIIGDMRHHCKIGTMPF